MRTTQRDALEALAAQGEPDAIMELQSLPKLPAEGAHVWKWFTELNETRSIGSMGPSRLTRAEIRDWERDEGITLAMWERRTILSMDSAWLASALQPKAG